MPRNIHGVDKIVVWRNPDSQRHSADLSYLYNALLYPRENTTLVFKTERRYNK